MKTSPLQPARIDWAADGTPFAPDFDDRYHPAIGAAAQARHVFLGGNQLPARWAGRDDFCIAEAGFGLGNNFIATWAAWREDGQRCRRLHYVALDAHPPRLLDLQRAHAGSAQPALAAQLMAAWPPLVPGLHAIAFDGGAVRLLLALGDVRTLLPELVFEADAFYLDGFAPALNPAMWEPRVLKALARRARPRATAATWSVARELRAGLSAAGFEWQRAPGIGGKREVLQARHAPRFVPRRTAQLAGADRRALVIGAGLAGACTAAALQASGFEVQVLEREAEPASGASGNPAGLFHATVHGDDSAHARLFRAAALHAARLIDGLDPVAVPRGRDGLLRLEHRLTLAAMQALLDRQGLPADFVQALDAQAASQRAGVPLAGPAWFYPAGGWVAPGALVRTLLARPGIAFKGRTPVHGLRRDGGSWLALDAAGRPLAAAPNLVLANAEQAAILLASIGALAPALQRTRGQVSLFVANGFTHGLRLPVAGNGYALPLPGGGLLCGATTNADDGGNDTTPREEDQRANVERLQQLCGIQAPVDARRWQGRVGWRVTTDDRLPLAGPLPALHQPPGARLDQARLVAQEPGLHLAIGFGGRGITLAPLLGDLVAARIAGTPLPLEQSLVDRVDPARWIVRAARRSS